MKIVFLDFDGVLNGLETWQEPPLDLGRPGNVEHDAYCLDADKVERLNRILKATGAFVVLSTSWRQNYPQNYLWKVLRHKGFKGFILGCTPSSSWDYQYRGDEILAWVEQVRPESYVVLDDMPMQTTSDDLKELQARHVQSEEDWGITDHHVEAAISVLRTPLESG